ncbi:MAG TPA: hypothetical protein VL001_03955 [Candidimonas sp.]|nr:hypothetical protein [Candidimonas sp.]
MNTLNFHRRAAMMLAVVPLAMLAACANMAETPPGAPLHEVEARFGQPNFSCPGDNGTQRLIWTQQPSGQYAWGTNVDPSNRIDRMVPLLTDEHFRVLASGVWTQDRVRCEFGPPAQISTVGLPSVRQLVWSYRYRQSKTWNSLMHVYFGQDGAQVTRFHPGPDPMFDRENFLLIN